QIDFTAQAGFHSDNALFEGDGYYEDSPENLAITPILARLHKEVNAPENETAVGRNFEREYTITVEVAPDEALSNLTVTDLLPDNVVITEIPGQGDWTFSLNRSGS